MTIQAKEVDNLADNARVPLSIANLANMTRTLPIAPVIIALLLALVTGCSPRDRVIDVAADDPEMNAAIARARDTLPDFWKVFDKPEHGETDFALKVKISDQHGTEHFWVVDIHRQDGKITGTINNDPDIVSTVKLGQKIEIPEADISDWLYMRDGKMVGNETIRPLLKKMPADEAAKMKSIMAEP